jgi:hypothetical protein
MTPEGKVKVWMKATIKKRYDHVAVWRYAPPGGAFGQAGTMDELCLISCGIDGAPGVFVGIEVKAEGQKLTPLQESRLRSVHRAGGVAASLIGRDEAKMAAIITEIERRRTACRLAWQIMTGQHTKDGSPSPTSEPPSNSS